MNLIIILLGGVATVVVVAIQRHFVHHLALTRDALLKGLIKSRGGRIIKGPDVPKPARFLDPAPTFETRIGEAILRLTFDDSSVDGTTRVEAHFVSGRGPQFEVKRRVRGVFQALLRPGIALGDEDFDSLFETQGADQEAIASAWSGKPMRRFCGHLRLASAYSNGRCVTITMPSGNLPSVTVEAMLDVAGGLATYGTGLLEPLAQLPQVTLTPAGGEWEAPTPTKLHMTTRAGKATARLRATTGKPRLVLRIRAQIPVAAGGYTLAEASAKGLTTGLIAANVDQPPAWLHGVSIVVEEAHLGLLWPGVPTPEDFLNGADLLAAMVVQSRQSSVYR